MPNNLTRDIARSRRQHQRELDRLAVAEAAACNEINSRAAEYAAGLTAVANVYAAADEAPADLPPFLRAMTARMADGVARTAENFALRR